jgi:hypothetical protein
VFYTTTPQAGRSSGIKVEKSAFSLQEKINDGHTFVISGAFSAIAERFTMP